jgi:hypothetical protein
LHSCDPKDGDEDEHGAHPFEGYGPENIDIVC